MNLGELGGGGPRHGFELCLQGEWTLNKSRNKKPLLGEKDNRTEGALPGQLGIQRIMERFLQE